LSSRIDTVSKAKKQGLMEKRGQKYKQYKDCIEEKERKTKRSASF
jgi:hypothetical protein